MQRYIAQQTQEARKYLDLEGIQQAMNKAVRNALKKHKQAGHKVPVWHQGRVVYVEPEY
jgi:uncharacterized protein YgbK (DUF1537 family)